MVKKLFPDPPTEQLDRLQSEAPSATVSFEPGFPMWHPSAKLSVARNRSKGNSDGFCHQDHARQHEIESEWDMVAFDIAGRAVSRTHRPCRLHA